MTTKNDVLKSLDIGSYVAEDEAEKIKEYFLETNTWESYFKGDVDIIYGQKGAGKSAIYLLTQEKRDEFFDNKVLLAPGEEIRGNPAFQGIVNDPVPSEIQFEEIWKIFILSILCHNIRDYGIAHPKINHIVQYLESARLIDQRFSLTNAVRRAFDFVMKREYAITDPNGYTFSTKLANENFATNKQFNIDTAFSSIDETLIDSGYHIWVLLDRLDVAFADTELLEKNALRALFRAYSSLKRFRNIGTKIFLRSDIWGRVSDGMFREASHITKEETINWDETGLKRMIALRLFGSPQFCEFVGALKSDAQNDIHLLDEKFTSVLPERIDRGEKKPRTWKWVLSRLKDGNGAIGPREVIFYFSELVKRDILLNERGEEQPQGTILFRTSSFKDSLKPVSEYKVHRVLYAEFPWCKKYIEALHKEKTEQTASNLAKIWKIDISEAEKLASKLSEIGFFEQRSKAFWVPFIYRIALNMVQGRSS